MELLRYLAYGSNLHPRRLGERVPSATPLGSIVLSEWQLAFEKRGRDGSAKCNLRPRSNPSPHRSAGGKATEFAYGVVYEIRAPERAALDAAEDLGRGYLEQRLQTDDYGQVFFYRAAEAFVDVSLKPFDWYHALVVAGARHHGLPQTYLEQMERIESTADPNRARRAEALRLLRG